MTIFDSKDNVIDLFNHVSNKPKDAEQDTDPDLEDLIVFNQKKKDRLAKERQQQNEQVKRSYRLKNNNKGS